MFAESKLAARADGAECRVPFSSRWQPLVPLDRLLR
jgi:hypothetical protein